MPSNCHIHQGVYIGKHAAEVVMLREYILTYNTILRVQNSFSVLWPIHSRMVPFCTRSIPHISGLCIILRFLIDIGWIVQPLENTHAYTIYNFYVYQCLLQTSMACNRIIKHSGYCGELYKVHFFYITNVLR